MSARGHRITPCVRFELEGSTSLIIEFRRWMDEQSIYPLCLNGVHIDRDNMHLGWILQGYLKPEEAERVVSWLRARAPERLLP